MEENALLNLAHRKEAELPFDEYTVVSKKRLIDEKTRQNDLLFSLNQTETKDEETINTIALIKENLALLNKKIKAANKENRQLGFDHVFRAFTSAIMVLYCISLLFFPLWMIKVSFQAETDYLYNTLGFIKEWDFTNYLKVFDQLSYSNKVVYTNGGVDIVSGNIWTMALTSVVYSFGISFVSVALTTGVAYVLAKYKFPGSKFLFSLGVVLMIVPIVGNTPSAMVIRSQWLIPTYNNLFLTIMTSNAVAFSGLNFLLVYGAFKSLPWDYAEAVFVDGGGHYSAFFKMYLPMVLPTSAVIFLLTFLGQWNDYASFKIWLPSYSNLAYGLYEFQDNVLNLSGGGTAGTVPMVMAGFTVVVIPTMIIYFLSQKLIMSKFTVGGLKG